MSSRVSIKAEVVERFLGQLNAEGWKIGADQFIAAINVVSTLTARPELLGSGSVVDWLAPVICRSRTEQQTFRERFRAVEERGAVPEDEDPILRIGMKLTAARGTRRRLTAIAVLALVPAILLSLGFWFMPSDGATVGPEKPGVEKPTGPALEEPVLNMRLLSPIAAGLLLVAGVWATFRRRRHYDLTKTLAREGEVTDHFPKIGTSLFLPSDFRRMTQRLRRRRQVAAADLNIDRTVDVTARSGGFFMPVYATRGMTPEYLALVDRSSVDDQHALLHRAVLDRVRSDDVIVDVYEFHGDPRICWREAREDDRHTLDDLISRHFDRTLLLFADGNTLVHPLTRAPYHWTEMMATSFRSAALLTSRPVDEWDDAEWRLARAGLLVLPSTTAGMTTLVDSLERPANIAAPNTPSIGASSILHDEDTWMSNFPAERERIAELIAELESRFGEDGMNWLAACAVYPAMHWYLTLYLGAKLNISDMERKLVELVRLPWFRRGVMPDWLRSELILTLSRPIERAIRQHISELFRIAVTEQHGRSPIHLVTFNDLKNAAPDDSPLREYVLVRFMSGRSPKTLTVRVREMYEGVKKAVREVRVRRDAAWRVLAAACVPFLGFFATIGKAASTELRWHAWNALVIVFSAGLLLNPLMEFTSKPTPYLAIVGAALITALTVAGFRALNGARLRVPVLSRLADHMVEAECGAPLNRALRLLVLLASYSNPITGACAIGIRIPDLRWHARAGTALSALLWAGVFGGIRIDKLVAVVFGWILLVLVVVGTYFGMRQRALPLLPRALTGVFPKDLPERDRSIRVPLGVYPHIAVAAYVAICATLALNAKTLSPLNALYASPWEPLLALAFVMGLHRFIGRRVAMSIGLLLTIGSMLATFGTVIPALSGWLLLAGVSLLLPNTVLAAAEAAQRKRRNPAPAVSALAVTLVLAVIAAQGFRSQLNPAIMVVALTGVVLFVLIQVLEFGDAPPQANAATRPGRFRMVASSALLGFVLSLILGMAITPIDQDVKNDEEVLLIILVLVSPVMFVTHLAAGMQSDPAKRIANSLIAISAAAVAIVGHVAVVAKWGKRTYSFGSGAELLMLLICVFTVFVLLLPAGWLYALTIAPRLRAAGVAAWSSIIIGGCAIGMNYASALETPILAAALALVTVVYFQRDRIAVQLRLADGFIRRRAGSLRRVPAAAQAPAPAQ